LALIICCHPFAGSAPRFGKNPGADENASPLFGLPLSILLLRERATAKKVVGTLLTTLGVGSSSPNMPDRIAHWAFGWYNDSHSKLYQGAYHEMNLRVPGPTPLPPSVIKAMNRQMVSHRGDEFATIFKEVTTELKTFFQTSNDVLILASSGTGGLEAAVVNFLSMSPNFWI